MSTKTTFKRIALVAVASLGFGLLSVVPSNAASTLGDVYFGASQTVAASASVAVGVETAVAITVSHTSDVTPTAVTLTPTLVKPVASSAAVTSVYLNYTLAAGTNQTAAGQVPNITTGAIVATSTATAATATVFAPVIKFKPDVPGIYTLTFDLTGAGVAGGTRAIAAVLTVYAGYSADSLRANRAFPTQGSNVTTGWGATVGGQATVRITGFPIATARTYYVTTDNGAIVAGTEQDTNTNMATLALTNGANLSGGFNFALDGSSALSDAMDVTVTDLGAASTTVSVKYFDAGTGVATTFAAATVTWGVAAAASAQYSLLTLNAGAGTTATGSAADTDATTVARTVSAAKNFTIQVVVKDQYAAALNAKTISATITGPGLIGIADSTGAGAATGRSLSQLLTANAGSVSVWADGSAGEATITISVGTVVLGSKVVTFVGAPATATVTQLLTVAKTGTQLGATPSTVDLTNTQATFLLRNAFVVSVKDANGALVAPGAVTKMVSSDSTKIVVGTCAENSTYSGKFECSVSGAVGAASGASATVTFSVYNAATLAYDIVGTPMTFSVGGAIASTVVTLDKASYSPGEAMVLSVVSKDSAGNPAYDGQAIYAAIASNKAIGGTLPATTGYINGGTRVSSATSPVIFAPAVDGTFQIRGTTVATVAAPLGTAFVIDAVVENGVTTAASQAAADAASEATDAANAATDAANAAAEAADAATAAAQDAADAVAALSTSVTAMVADLRKQITALTNLVIKIQKKVRA
jgi:trimeric autotransporter adhesin